MVRGHKSGLPAALKACNPGNFEASGYCKSARTIRPSLAPPAVYKRPPGPAVVEGHLLSPPGHWLTFELDRPIDRPLGDFQYASGSADGLALRVHPPALVHLLGRQYWPTPRRTPLPRARSWSTFIRSLVESAWYAPLAIIILRKYFAAALSSVVSMPSLTATMRWPRCRCSA